MGHFPRTYLGFFVSCEKCLRNVDGIASDLHIALRSTDILTLLILPGAEHESFFRVFVLSSVSLLSVV